MVTIRSDNVEQMMSLLDRESHTEQKLSDHRIIILFHRCVEVVSLLKRSTVLFSQERANKIVEKLLNDYPFVATSKIKRSETPAHM